MTQYTGFYHTRNFLLFCAPRSGSTALANYLRDIDVPLGYEPFRNEKWLGKEKKAVETTVIRLYLEFQGIKHVETHLNVTENIKLLRWCNNLQLRIVFLKRRNIRELALSHFIAQTIGTWELNGMDPRTAIIYDEVKPPKVPIHKLKILAGQYRSRWKEYDNIEWNNPGLHFTAVYDHIFNNPKETATEEVNKILEFLSLDSPFKENLIGNHFSPDQKQNLPAFYEKIPNWDEVKAYVYG